MKKAKKHSLDHNRRKFLRKSAKAGAGVAVAAALPDLVSGEEERLASEAKVDKGYRLTPHIVAYYETMIS
ncbi:MAG: twin-arginine translocation signal domain-containing protein [Chromatiales bacterium]|jgi:hypothetical protein